MNTRLLSFVILFASAGFAQDSVPSVPDSVAVPDTTHVEFPTSVDPGGSAPADSMPATADSAIAAREPDSPAPHASDSVREAESGSVTRTVTVKGQARHKRKEISTSTLRREDAKKVVATMQDPLRALSTLPGVSTTSDLSVRPVVRGGDMTETGVQLDGVPLLMPYHFGSVFSVFHQESIEDFQLYSGVAPASAEGMLSGMVVARSRSAPVDTFFGGVDVSMLRGSAWLGVPLIKDRVGLWLSAQSLWYDWTLKRFMDLGVLLGAADKDDVEEYKSMVTLPTSWDLQGGISAKLGRDWMLDVGGFVAGDKFRILEDQEICLEGGKEVRCEYGGHWVWDTESRSYVQEGGPKQEHQTIYDTTAIVDLTNWMARTRLSWNPDRDLAVEAVGALQSVDWNARFPGRRELECDSTGKKCKVVRVSDSTIFDWTRAVKDLGLSARKRWSEEHETSVGFGYGDESQSAKTHIARPAAQLIMGTTGNPMEFFGVFNEGEVRLPGKNNRSILDIERFADMDFEYDSSVSWDRPSGWIEHRWDPDSRTRIRTGVRFSSDAQGELDIPNPRLQVQRQITEQDLFGLGIALHTQRDMPFEWNFAASKPLKSEKAWLGIVEWEHAFAPGWRSTVSGWGKIYRDLASPSMVVTKAADSTLVGWAKDEWLWTNYKIMGIPDAVGSFTFSCWERFQGLPDSLYTPACDSAWKEFQVWRRSYVPTEVAQAIEYWYSDRRLTYESTGEGWAAGLELSLRYQPTQAWTGWASAEWSISRRRDRPDGIWYDFGLDRTWKLSWVNAFRIDKKWEISLRYAAQAGNPYTPSSLWGQMFDGDDSDSVMWIGKRNSARLAPYQRLDLRVARESRMFGFPATFYYEMWNAFNDPNMILRDNESGQFRWVHLNVPFPTVFLGMEVRF